LGPVGWLLGLLQSLLVGLLVLLGLKSRQKVTSSSANRS
jgi:hypothetical protein